jgi:hypothetical protein
MALSKELKAAILALPRDEKDKLLLRLVGKHADLQEQLQFRLVEEEATLEERREALHRAITRLYNREAVSSGFLMMDMRELHGELTRHVKITKDAYGEVDLLLHLLNGVFDQQLRWIERYSSKSDTLALYVAKRTEALLKKLAKLHPDLQFEFLDATNRLLDRVWRYAPAYYAKELALPKRYQSPD